MALDKCVKLNPFRDSERGLSCSGASVTGLQPDKADGESECNDGALQTADSTDKCYCNGGEKGGGGEGL